MKRFAVVLLLSGTACVTVPDLVVRDPVPQAQVEPDTLIDFDDPLASEENLRELLDGAEGPYRLEVLTQIARAQGLQGRFDAAHKTLDGVEAEVASAGPRVRVYYLLERGRAFNSADEPDKATPLFVEAFELAQGADLIGLAIDAAHMVAIAKQGTPEELAWGLKGLALAEASDDPDARSWLGPLYNNLGWTYHDAGQFPEALDLFQKGLAVRRSQDDDDAIFLARWAVARCLRSLGRYDKALGIQEQLESETARRGEPDGFVFEEIAELHLVKGDDAAAREWFAKALPLLEEDKWLREDEPERLQRIRDILDGKPDGADGVEDEPEDPAVEPTEDSDGDTPLDDADLEES